MQRGQVAADNARCCASRSWGRHSAAAAGCRRARGSAAAARPARLADRPSSLDTRVLAAVLKPDANIHSSACVSKQRPITPSCTCAAHRAQRTQQASSQNGRYGGWLVGRNACLPFLPATMRGSVHGPTATLVCWQWGFPIIKPQSKPQSKALRVYICAPWHPAAGPL